MEKSEPLQLLPLPFPLELSDGIEATKNGIYKNIWP